MKYFFAFTILFFYVPSSHAEDLFELYKRAVQADPALLSVQYEVDASHELHRQSLANFLPVLTAQYQTQTSQQEILRSENVVYAQGKEEFPSKNITLSITQPIFHLDSFFAYKQTELGEMKAQVELGVAKQDLMFRLVDSYLETLKSMEDEALAKKEKETLESELELSQAKYNNGLLSVSELRDVEARYAEMEALEVSESVRVLNAMEELRSMVGTPIGGLVPLRRDGVLPQIDIMPIEERVNLALNLNPVILSRSLAIAIAEKEKDRLSAQHFPVVDLNARYNDRDSKGSLFGGGSRVKTTEVMLQVDIPLYSGGRTQSKVRESLYRTEQAKQELETKRRSVARDVRSGYVTLISSQRKIDALQQVVKAKKSLHELRSEGYIAGIYSILMKLEAQRDYFVAEHDLLAARYEHLLNFVKIKQASGTLNENDLKTINTLLSF